MQQEAGGVEHLALAQPVQALGARGVGLPRGDGRGVAERAQAVGLRLVERLPQPREVVRDAPRPWGLGVRAPGIFVAAALLVFVEVMKELPATALLRPLGGDTLAVAVWEATRDSRFDVAAFPALLIVAVGLVPVLLAIRFSRGRPEETLLGPS